ncbi:hypothetical protein LTR37_009213 [Vermiconidia calcicola]|uniref:Uncharacterized protein n=1 Tax=Vermiconidia calcicola TaxID=1690605 RepID=A0ACC3N8P9_9PEZI|nr:hypothetical protein LTR37_009213 [Vermiconidia calcicola]
MSGLEKSGNNMSNKQTEQVVPMVEKKQEATTSSDSESSSSPESDAAGVTGDVTELGDELRLPDELPLASMTGHGKIFTTLSANVTADLKSKFADTPGPWT